MPALALSNRFDEMFGPIDPDSLDPRKFMPTPLDLIASLGKEYAEYEAHRDDRTSIRVTQFPDQVTTALGILKAHSKGRSRRASDGAALSCCASHGLDAIRDHRVARENIQFTRDLYLLTGDCDLTAHEIVASQFREFPVSLGTMGGSKVRSLWLPGHLGNRILGLAQNMGAKPGQLLMVAVMSALSTQDGFLSGERRQALARTVGEYLKGYTFRGRLGLAALKVVRETKSEAEPWD